MSPCDIAYAHGEAERGLDQPVLLLRELGVTLLALGEDRHACHGHGYACERDEPRRGREPESL
jgi:hypothetical protein